MDEILKYERDLINYVRSKIHNDDWQDVVQDTLMYLCIKVNDINITNTKGLVLNTGRFFVNTYFKPKKEIQNIIEKESIDISYILKHFTNIDKTQLKPFLMSVYGYKIKDIANILKINENTIKTRIRACRNKLRNEMYIL